MKSFDELRAKMSPEAQQRADERAQEMLREIEAAPVAPAGAPPAYDILMLGHDRITYTLVRCADGTRPLVAIANLDGREAIEAAWELIADANRGAAVVLAGSPPEGVNPPAPAAVVPPTSGDLSAARDEEQKK